jgi:hypothetical protein
MLLNVQQNRAKMGQRERQEHNEYVASVTDEGTLMCGGVVRTEGRTGGLEDRTLSVTVSTINPT